MATLIYDVDDLQDMNLDLTADYELANDIDAIATLGWNGGLGFEPIGWYQAPGFEKFTGSFDGKEYTISNLYINRPTTAYSGLFGRVEGAGSLKNVKLTNVTIVGDYLAGALAGDTYVDVENCSSTGSVTGGNGGGGVGGLLGYAYGNVDKCRSTCTVTSTTADWGIGGLIGYAGLALGEAIELCCATGDVSAPSADEVGGLIGDCDGDVSNSYALGDVAGDQYVGGLVGTNSETIDKSYSTGKPTGNNDVGGLCGDNSGTITDSFWDTETSEQATSDGGTGKTTTQMKLLATFSDAGWDIEVSGDDLADGYPFLGWQSELGIFPTWLIYTLGEANAQAIAGINITETTATLFGRIVDDAGAACERRFRYKEEGGVYTTCAWTNGLVTNDTFSEDLSGLTGSTRYEFAAQAKNVLGVGEWSSSVYFMTLSPRKITPVEDVIALEAIRNVEMTGRGRFYTDEEGRAVYKSRYGRNP